MELHSLWICLLLLTICTFQPAESTLLCNRACGVITRDYQQWCKCSNNGASVDLTESGIFKIIKTSSIAYYFGNAETDAFKCRPETLHNICLCPRPATKTCKMCRATTDIVCIRVDDENNVLVTDIGTNETCNVTADCTSQCDAQCQSDGIETLAPVVKGRHVTTTPMVTMTPPITTTVVEATGSINSALAVAGIGILILIMVLSAILIFFCRKKKVVRKKRDSPYESVYSTIDDNSITNVRSNGHVNDHIPIVPNRLYDARVEPKHDLSVARPEQATHYKSLPAMHSPSYIQSEFNNTDYQPYLPKQKAVWKNGQPTLHRYPTVDDTTGYARYNTASSDDVSPTTPYMYLTKPTSPAPGEENDDLPMEYRHGYKVESQTAEQHGDANYDQLIREHRSLPADGNRIEWEPPRSHATYGFEKRKPTPSQSSELKPIPAKRGAYRSQGDIHNTDESETENDISGYVKQDSMDSSEGEYNEPTLGSSPHYVTVDREESQYNDVGTELMMDSPEYQKPPESHGHPKEETKRNPKPRTRRRQRRRPTTEVTCEMTENPLVSSHDEDETEPSDGHCTDDDEIEAGLMH